MKAQEKTLLYNLLKAADDNFYGYSSPEFNHMPDFTDDPETEKAPETIGSSSDNQKPDFSTEFKNEPSEKAADSAADGSKGITLEKISKKIMECRNCKLCSGRKNPVPGMGVEHPDVLVVGEGPGEEEDQQGLPFVGPAGQLLDKMLSAIQLSRNENCYIANTVKCRPPYNRDPETEETEACRTFLDAQIHVLKPKMILALGKVAVRDLLKIQGEFSLNRYRGQIFDYNGIPVVITYHPSALLRNFEYKKPAWEDLKFFKTKLMELSSEYADKTKQS